MRPYAQCRKLGKDYKEAIARDWPTDENAHYDSLDLYSKDLPTASSSYHAGPTLYCDGCNKELESDYGDSAEDDTPTDPAEDTDSDPDPYGTWYVDPANPDYLSDRKLDPADRAEYEAHRRSEAYIESREDY